MPDLLLTWAEAMSERGYRTTALSANPHVISQFGFAQGFDTFEAFAEEPSLQDLIITPVLGPDGGLRVNEYLQSVDHPEVFGGGDCIYFEDRPMDKVGVYAVRENPVLYHNLKAAL